MGSQTHTRVRPKVLPLRRWQRGAWQMWFPSHLKCGHLEIRQHRKANNKPVLVCTSCTGHCHLKPIVQEKGSTRRLGEVSYHHCFPKLLHELLPQRKRPSVLRKWQRFPTVLTDSVCSVTCGSNCIKIKIHWQMITSTSSLSYQLNQSHCLGCSSFFKLGY